MTGSEKKEQEQEKVSLKGADETQKSEQKEKKVTPIKEETSRRKT